MLRLKVFRDSDPRRWQWRLTGTDGEPALRHQVALDPAEWQFEALTDLYQFLKANAAPDRRRAHEAELAAQIGDWVSGRVLGPLAVTLARHGQPVRVDVPADAGAMTYWPWELARVEGRTLAEYGVRFIMHQPPHRPVAKVSVGERLRMLAVFSLPEDTGTLNLRKERLALTSLVREIAEENHTNIELQVLQYGATRQRLRRLLGEPGWDIVHLSGHGLATGLILEDDAGRPDLISA